MSQDVTRRVLLTALAASPLAACASPRGHPASTIQVNLTRTALPPAPEGVAAEAAPEADGAVRTGFDTVRRMTVEAMVNESGPYAFVVDTGANRSVLSSEIAETLGLARTGATNVHGIAGMLPSYRVDVRRLGVGEVVSRRVAMPVLPRRYLGADGLLGVDVLARRRATLDFDAQTFTIQPPRRTPNADSRVRRSDDDASPRDVVVPAKQRFGQLTIVDAELGGVPLTAFLDSGAEITVGNRMLEGLLTGRPGLLRSPATPVELVSATGQLVGGSLVSVPPLRLGGVRLGNLSCVFADLHTFKIWDLDDRPAMLIGVDVMRHFDSIELDFERRNVTFRSRQFGRSAPTVGGL